MVQGWQGELLLSAACTQACVSAYVHAGTHMHLDDSLYEILAGVHEFSCVSLLCIFKHHFVLHTPAELELKATWGEHLSLQLLPVAKRGVEKPYFQRNLFIGIFQSNHTLL